MKFFLSIFVFIALQASLISANIEDNTSIIYLQPNTTQLFTELYQSYGLLHLPQKTFFEEALYLDQSTHPSIFPMQPSNQTIFDHASDVLSEFHRNVHDLELYIDPSKPKPFFYTASGSKHLIVALVYAIAQSEPNKKFVFVEEAPFYSGHPSAVTGIFNYPNARFLAIHDPSHVPVEPDEILVEIVTSPNNPDGKFRKPITDAKIIIADFVFASSAFGSDGTGYLDKNIDWIREARKSGKHLFSFNSASKQFGKTGNRCGYIWYPIYDSYAASIFKNFFGFISASTVAGGSTGLADFLNLIKAFIDLPDHGKALRQDAHHSLVKRHKLMEQELMRIYPGSTITSIPGSPTLFVKLKDSRIPQKNGSKILLEDFKISTNPGDSMGESDEFVRLNLSGYSSLLVDFLNRLAGQNKYKIQDVLSVSTHECPHTKVFSKGGANTLYIAVPGDCVIDAEASGGPIEIILPDFIDYEMSHVITINKLDSSAHQIVVKSSNFTQSVKSVGETLQVKWSQPHYLNGQWEIETKQEEK